MLLVKRAVCLVLLLAGARLGQAQQVRLIKSNLGAKRQVEQEALIRNQETGQLLTMEQYGELSKDDPYAYHLMPVYNELGIPDGYVLRKATPEERETHRFRDRDPAKQPKAGQAMLPFVMIGIDGKAYRSTDLLGKVVVLTFLVSLEKEFWSNEQNETLTRILKSYQSKGALVSLGVLNSEQAKPGTGIKPFTWPFTPIPNAYGFHNKYHITSVPTFVILDKAGKVAANIQGAESFEKLKQILASLP